MADAADFKVTRIKGGSALALNLLGETVKLAQEHVPKLRQTAENRVLRRNMEDSLTALGAYCRKNGFDPTRTFQHVANVDNEVWLMILAMFARYDDAGELMDDGALYKFDEAKKCLVLNKPFFYALIDYLEALGIPVDMRGKIKLT